MKLTMKCSCCDGNSFVGSKLGLSSVKNFLMSGICILFS